MNDVTWWTAFGGIAQAAGAVATFAAVAVSLWIVRSERELRGTVSAGIRIVFEGDGSPGVYLVAISIVNTGLRPFRVVSVGWQTGWLRRGPNALTHRLAIQNPSLMQVGSRPPFVIEPGMDASVFTTIADMRQGDNPDARTAMFERNAPLLGAAPIKAMVNIVGRKAITARVERDLAAFLRTNQYPATTAEG